jgi:hypothetical protein
MIMMETTLNKNMYKVFISVIKFLPNLLALFKMAGLVLSYFKMSSFVITCLGGTSIVLLVLMYLISIIFKFCGHHRISLHYVITITLLSIYDFYIGIPLNVKNLFKLYILITGVFVSLWIWFFYKNRKNPKVDHIKQLCERYICC